MGFVAQRDNLEPGDLDLTSGSAGLWDHSLENVREPEVELPLL